MQKQVHKR